MKPNPSAKPRTPKAKNGKLSEVVPEVIRLAEAIRAYWDAELPKRHPNYPWVRAGEDSGPRPPEERALNKLLTGLPADTIYSLMVIMYLGRGDFVGDLSAAFAAMKSTFPKPENAIAQMIHKGALGEYLIDGLAELEKNGVPLDRVPQGSISRK